MDRISPLPDELLLRILSFLPTKEVVPTMVLSKRWKPLWMSVPNLEYDDTNHNTDYSRFFRFVQCSLFLHKAPVLESLCFILGPRCGAVDMEIWVKLAVSRCLRKLEIDLSNNRRLVRLPESLYTCKTLESLILRGALLVDVRDPVCLPSLVNLCLANVTYSSDESVLRLLSGCPILEFLSVRLFEGDNVMTFTVKVPSLQALDIARKSEELQNNNHGIVIDAPSLIVLNITDHSGGFCLVKNLPKVGIAKIDVIYNNSEKLLVSLTSLRHLRLCLLTPKPAYPQGSIFHLKNLELCTCTEGWLDLLMSLLQDSPKLRVLKLTLNHVAQTARRVWNKPSSVPECCSSNLKTFEWSSYKGAQEERELVKFILRNGKSLRTVIISSKSTNLKQKFQMMKELTYVSKSRATLKAIRVFQLLLQVCDTAASRLLP